MSHWLDLPVIAAPSAEDRNKTVYYMISSDFIDRNAIVKRRTQILQLWVHLTGKVPPVNNSSRLLRGNNKIVPSTLNSSVACFKGVNRPYDDEDDGASILVYVLNPPVTVEYSPDMVCVAQSKAVPALAPATVQVKPIKTLQIGGMDICGKVTRIEFVIGDGGTPTLPKGSADRYTERLW